MKKSFLRDPVNFQVVVLNQVPHEKQIEVLDSPAKHKTIRCGRRSGKSQLVAGELIRGSWTGEYPRQIVIGPEYKHCRIVYEKIRDLLYEAQKVMPMDVKFIKSPQPRIVINDSIIDFGSADNPVSLRGEGYDRIFLDEAAFLKEESIHALKPMGFDTGAPIWMTSSPWGKGYFKEKDEWGQKGIRNYASFHYNYKDNPYLHPEGVEEVEQEIEEYGMDSAYVQAEILGNWIDDVDTYFKADVIKESIEEYELYNVAALNPYRKNVYVLGVDVARMGQDKSVFIVIEKNHKNDNLRVVHIEETHQKKLTDAIGRILYLHSKFNFAKVYIDETGLGGGVHDVVQESLGKSRVEGITFTTQSKTDMYSNLDVHLQRKMLTLPTHKKLIWELMDLRCERQRNGSLKIYHSERGHDDYPDALALACWHFQTKTRRMPFGIK